MAGFIPAGFALPAFRLRGWRRPSSGQEIYRLELSDKAHRVLLVRYLRSNAQRHIVETLEELFASVFSLVAAAESRLGTSASRRLLRGASVILDGIPQYLSIDIFVGISSLLGSPCGT